MRGITIVDYLPKHQPLFEQFNRDWIEKYFRMEALDEWVLTQPEAAIIETGGAILMAYYNGQPAGTVALRKLETGIYEFTKMAVSEDFQRKGIARALSHASFKRAKELGATKVILYSNSVLTPAIHLYEQLGFKHIPMGKAEYKRSDVKMSIAIADAENYIPSPVTIKRAVAVDAPAIAAIGPLSFRKAFGKLFDDQSALDTYLLTTYDQTKLAKSIEKENNVYFLARINEVPVGFAKIKKHSLNEQIDSFNQAELQKIYVLPDQQGKGVGEVLMQGVIRLCNEIKPNCIWLDTHIANFKAIKFYEKTGFKKTGKHHFNIGTQTFEYDLMAMPVIMEPTLSLNH